MNLYNINNDLKEDNLFNDNNFSIESENSINFDKDIFQTIYQKGKMKKYNQIYLVLLNINLFLFKKNNFN